MKRFIENRPVIFIIVAVFIIASIIGIFSAMTARDKATFAEGAVQTLTEPGKRGATGVVGWLTSLFNRFESLEDLREENRLLKQENIELDKKIRDNSGLEEENYELRKMLDLVEKEASLKLQAVRIVAKNPSNWYSTITINKGEKDGIKKNQPVLTANKELIGQVYKVGFDWAEIITVLDPESGVGSMVERSRDTGITEGDSALKFKGYCKLGYMSRMADIKEGDYVETSGLGGIYPKGLLIGTVVNVVEDNVSMTKSATVKPMVDFGNINEAFVLMDYVEDIERKPTTDSNKKDDDPDEDDGDVESGSDEETRTDNTPAKVEEEEETSSGGMELSE